VSKSFNLDAYARLVRLTLMVSALILLAGGAMTAREKTRPLSVAPVAPVALAHLHATDWVRSGIGTVNADVFKLALGAADCAVRSGAIEDPSTLTVIDYSKPSTSKRLWVFDLHTHELLYQELVAHGKGSGEKNATMFSNEPETHRSSIGLFETKDAYIGKNGYSLRLNGLDVGFNDRALERAIVMHGAAYVSDAFALTQGRLGRSWGCPAVREGIARDLIDRVKSDGLVFAYYPDPAWLSSSKYLGGCAAAN
jgi:hypothetical protein